MFLSNEPAIYAAINAQRAEGAIVESVAEVKKTHTVKSGEKLSSIARRYGVTVADLRSWNYIGSKGIRPGKKLVVYVREQKNTEQKLDLHKDAPQLAAKDAGESKQLAANNATKQDFIWHKVRKGESLFGISKKYGMTPAQLIEFNNLKGNDLRIGQLLKIRPKGE